jgi:hypothetical protein
MAPTTSRNHNDLREILKSRLIRSARAFLFRCRASTTNRALPKPSFLLIPLVGFLLLSAALTSCSSRNTLTKEDVRSRIILGMSVASEADILVDRVTRRLTTRHYSEGHAEYLAEEVRQSLQELKGAVPGADAETSFRECTTELDRLARELSRLRNNLTDSSSLNSAKVRISTIHEELLRIRDSP